MQTAWRERNPKARIRAAREALAKNSEVATAYILLAEEEAPTVQEAERLFKLAWKAAESNYRKSQTLHHSAKSEALHREFN
jgi:hypothetical protein